MSARWPELSSRRGRECQTRVAGGSLPFSGQQKPMHDEEPAMTGSSMLTTGATGISGVMAELSVSTLDPIIAKASSSAVVCGLSGLLKGWE